MSLKKIFSISTILKLSAGIIAFFMGALTVGVVVFGAYKAIKAGVILIEFLKTGDKNLHAGLAILDTLDIFLVSLVFLIFTVGIIQLFIKHDNVEYLKAVPKWLLVNNLAELKFLLMQTIIVTLFVMTIEAFIETGAKPVIEWLYIPGVILLLSISLALLMRAENKK
jgi:uncharacterized membrane protein YqhA